VRNLGALFEPKSIALIGASNQPRSVGAVTAKNLFEGGFPGPIMTVNPHEQAISRDTQQDSRGQETYSASDWTALPPTACPRT
jgi:predicted CoA-binding protein